MVIPEAAYARSTKVSEGRAHAFVEEAYLLQLCLFEGRVSQNTRLRFSESISELRT